MKQEGQFRHELKFVVPYAEYLALRSRLASVMKRDSHAGADGTYRVHSIYFDNFWDQVLREKINGLPRREKFRIRYYNDAIFDLTLEKKIKCGHLCLKLGTAMTTAECQSLLGGDDGWMRSHPAPLVRELYVKMRTQLLRPKVRVSYLREPYIYAAGNVRITFDSEIRTSLYDRECLRGQNTDFYAAECPQTMVMEVKYDAYLPEVIADLIQTNGVRQQEFSKYGVCRRFG